MTHTKRLGIFRADCIRHECIGMPQVTHVTFVERYFGLNLFKLITRQQFLLELHNSAKLVPIRADPGGFPALNCRSGRVGMPIGNSMPIFADQYQSARIRVGRQFLPGKTADRLGSNCRPTRVHSDWIANPGGAACRPTRAKLPTSVRIDSDRHNFRWDGNRT